MKKIAITTLGCKVNRYETECIRAQFTPPEYFVVFLEEEADIHIVNTCTVTQRADHKSRQAIRAAIKKSPEALIVVTGCYVQRSPNEIARIKGVDLVLGNQEKAKIRETIESFTGHTTDHSPITLEDRLPRQTRAYIKIQDGCDRFCNYCIVPYVRGKPRSRPLEDVMAEIRSLASSGFKEVVLCGINLGSYGRDLEKETLSQLIKEIEKVEGLARIRLSSLEPDLIDDELIETISSSSRVCPHLHISLQSGDDGILSKMNRNYTTAQFRSLIQRLNSSIPDIAVTTDVMVGFPGEGEESFQRTYKFIEEMDFSNLHVFKYSLREGTLASRFRDTVSEKIKKERAQMLAGLKKRLNLDFRKRFLGQEVEVLSEEKERNGYMVGLTPHYIRVFLEGDEIPPNEIVKVKIEEIGPDFTFSTACLLSRSDT